RDDAVDGGRVWCRSFSSSLMRFPESTCSPINGGLLYRRKLPPFGFFRLSTAKRLIRWRLLESFASHSFCNTWTPLILSQSYLLRCLWFV
ncbi:unnamed protein product, partial [Brassica oleracea]